MEQEAANDAGVTADGVWPPPPTGVPPVPGEVPPLLTFGPLRPLARPLLVLLTAYAATAALLLAFAPFPLAGQWVKAVGLLQAVLLLGIAAYFLAWTYCLSRNLRAFGAVGLRTAPAWAVVFFFVPLLNLYRPYQTFREIWQASDPSLGALAWRKARPPALLGSWWASVLLMSVWDALATLDAGSRGIEAADNAVDLLCALVTACVVRMVTVRQEARAALGVD